MTADVAAITRLVYDYADAVRWRDAKRWGDTWTADAFWILRGRRFEGRDAIVEAWKPALAKYAHVVQMYGSSAVEVNGSEATGRFYLTELNEDVDGGRSMLAGYYDDTYRRTADGWKFTSRELVIMYRGTPDLGGTFFDPS